MKPIHISVCILFLLSSCAVVKPYEMQYINDNEMQLGSDAGEIFKKYVQSIREGAVPAGSSKGSGGCGCN